MNIGFLEGLFFELWSIIRSWCQKNLLLASFGGFVCLVFAYWTITGLLAFGLSGGPRYMPISGKVTLDGQPLSQANISFKPLNGDRGGFGSTDLYGHYEIQHVSGNRGLLRGEYSVEITTGRIKTEYKKIPVAPTKSGTKQKQQAERVETIITTEKEVLPAKYNQSTTLSFNVEQKTGNCDWLLLSDLSSNEN